MAAIPRAALDYLTAEIDSVSESAKSAVLKVLESIEWTPDNIARCREIVVEALALVLPSYTDLSAQASADFYDAVRASALGEAYGASAVSGYDAAATEGAVRALVQRVADGGSVESFNRAVLARVDYEVKRAAGNSMVENGLADPARPRFARVPSGAETCGFCLMLAGRGFVYHSRETAGELHHYHANCDCRVVAGFDGMAEVEGYDPGEYLDLYSEARSRLGGNPSAGEISREMEKVLAERAGREKAFIPEEKLTHYALDMTSERGRDKAIAFERALGYTLEDADEITSQVYRWMGGHEPAKTGESEWGEIYRADIQMTGKNGKTATVRTGWIRYPGEDIMRLTSIYVH